MLMESGHSSNTENETAGIKREESGSFGASAGA
jgi:hypothetical protein